MGSLDACPALHSCSGCHGRKVPAQHPHRAVFCSGAFWFLVAVVIFSLHTADLYCHCFSAFDCRSPIDIGGGAVPGTRLEGVIESSLVQLERESCPELSRHTRVWISFFFTYFNLAFSYLYFEIVNFDFGVVLLLSLNFCMCCRSLFPAQ